MNMNDIRELLDGMKVKRQNDKLVFVPAVTNRPIPLEHVGPSYKVNGTVVFCILEAGTTPKPLKGFARKAARVLYSVPETAISFAEYVQKILRFFPDDLAKAIPFRLKDSDICPALLPGNFISLIRGKKYLKIREDGSSEISEDYGATWATLPYCNLSFSPMMTAMNK